MQIIALTSNDYVNVLPGFAYLFNKYYPDQKIKVVRYDVRPPSLPENFTNFAIGKQTDYSWSSGLKRYLDFVDDDLVLLMLEDYYLDKPVALDTINQLELLMKSDKSVLKIDLTNDRLKVGHKPYTKGYYDKDSNQLLQSETTAPFLASVQAAIWRVDFLKAILNKTDNAWQFEKNKRTKPYLDKTKGVILGCYNPPVSYVNAVSGEGSKPGVIDTNKLPQWMIDELKENGVYNG